MKEEEYSNAMNSADEAVMNRYHAYQKRFADKFHERDKVLASLFAEALEGLPNKTPKVLDIGCSTGNLLKQLKGVFPDCHYTGVDVAVGFKKDNLANPDLKGIDFDERNLFSLEYKEEFDIVITNLVLFGFSNDEFGRAVENIAAALRKGGTWLSLDCYHPFEQDVSLFEQSTYLPMGRKLFFRSYKSAREIMAARGFTPPKFLPFSMPFDLPKPKDHVDLTSYTLYCTELQSRLSFSGVICQPWCHLMSQKS
jgi:SAM-dependent methyltransferase